MLKGYLDTFNIIEVYMRKEHYNGQSAFFYLKDEDNTRVDLNVLEIKDGFEDIIYYLKTPDLQIGNRYFIYEEHGFKCLLKYRFVVKDSKFDKIFDYHGPLGSFIKDSITEFYIFAPTAYEVLLKLFLNEEVYLKMERGEQGVFFIKIDKSLAGISYRFLVNVNGVINETIDPYALASTANADKSVVVDHRIFNNKNQFLKKKLVPIIYEASVRDMTSDSIYPRGISYFESFHSEQDGYGLNYIASLGVSYLQLMPVLDFASVDELGDNRYNWGYDPIQFFVPEGSYCSDSSNPLVRIEELCNLITAIHNKKMGIILDVVYNHVYDFRNFSYELIVPFYFFRFDKNRKMSSGSFCHNDIDSERPMVRRLIADSLIHLTTNYGVDGFRFDLLGILDVETVRYIIQSLKAINPNVFLLAEGWSMPTALDENRRATMFNHEKMLEMAFFNDRFRDCLRGSLWSAKDSSGFLFSGQINGILRNILAGSCTHIGAGPLFSLALQSVNYVESHDNMTLFDKIANIEDEEEDIKQKIKLANALVIFSQGIPFFHAGQECGGSKKGHDNSYNLGDEINSFNYHLKDKNIDLVDYFRSAVDIKKKERLLNLSSPQEIVNMINFEEEDSVLKYSISDQQSTIIVYINATKQYKKYFNKESADIIFSADGLFENKPAEIHIPACSLVAIKIEKPNNK